MGVLGAFVFAAQMINFSIPGTGSSGHIIGGVLLASILGPWAAFITLASVLIIQCLVFADGGLMALGCNLINMGAMSCLVAYPLVFRPIAGDMKNRWRVVTAAIVASVVGLECGALLVTLETELSGITALPTGEFLMFMMPIHLAIGLCEGIATGAVLAFVMAYKPDIMYNPAHPDGDSAQDRRMSKRTKVVLAVLGSVALVFACTFTWIASGDPDGLEWSISKITGAPELAEAYVPATAVIPDYDSTFAGIIGGVMVMVILWAVCALLIRRRKRQTVSGNHK